MTCGQSAENRVQTLSAVCLSHIHNAAGGFCAQTRSQQQQQILHIVQLRGGAATCSRRRQEVMDLILLRRSRGFMIYTQTPVSALITAISLDILVSDFYMNEDTAGDPLVSHQILLPFCGLYTRQTGGESPQIIRRLSLGHLFSRMHVLRRKCGESLELSECLNDRFVELEDR